jgi:hypothetical protein
LQLDASSYAKIFNVLPCEDQFAAELPVGEMPMLNQPVDVAKMGVAQHLAHLLCREQAYFPSSPMEADYVVIPIQNKFVGTPNVSAHSGYILLITHCML